MATIGRKRSKPRDITKPVVKWKPVRPRIPFAMMFRMFVLGSVAVVSSGYAIYRHYTSPPPPMHMEAVPKPPVKTKTMMMDVDGGEVEVEMLPE